MIPDGNDLADPGTQRLSQQGDVDLVACQDHADRGPRQPQRRAERQGFTGHGPRANHHERLFWVTVQQLGSGSDGIRLAYFAADSGDQLSGAGGRLAEYGQRLLLDSIT